MALSGIVDYYFQLTWAVQTFRLVATVRHSSEVVVQGQTLDGTVKMAGRFAELAAEETESLLGVAALASVR